MTSKDELDIQLQSETTSRYLIPRRRRPPAIWLLAGPLVGGIVTHWWDLVALHRHSPLRSYPNDVIYAAEVAPQLVHHHPRHWQQSARPSRSHKQTVSLDGASWTQSAHGRPSEWERSQRRSNEAARHAQDRSQDDDDRHPEEDEEDDCIPMHSWQQSSHPMCNALHEVDFLSKFRNGALTYIDSGGFNDLFHLSEPLLDHHGPDTFANATNQTASHTTTELAIKILSYTKPHISRNYNIVRQDAVVLERLTKSPNIFPIHGYCGFALVLPYVSGGTLSSKLRKWRKGEIQISPRQRLRYAVEMARGLRDLHDIDHDGVPSVTHGDLKEQQYLITDDGGLQLGDFNKGQFLKKSKSTGEVCTFLPPPGYIDKVFRSPEEYAFRSQTAATDVWALGSLMFYLLTGARVWRDIAETHTEKVRRHIVQGKRPKIKQEILDSKDPVDVALRKAYNMCTVYDPDRRASAREVADYLETVWKELKY
ncbi:hypothetical protein HJC23_006501 [Cyclotella cryptica]|uniref:Protein kinase domain-containing protein n=1 Tax=Cyclotella cryptica TaxID=29204 RepID=A0ABD3PNM4_9STRA|eukprot:CCRYP_012975-RA/>CCRYP_012975-RA protein AED:0.34 eAED:0.34 QI:0/-1/0/1/-1/1/1/0/479